MPKKLIRKYLPHPDTVKSHSALSALGHRLHDANLWHLNRRSVARAFLAGMLVAFLPIPGQMLCAAILAMSLRGNLPIAVSMAWISNPMTFIPISWVALHIGYFLLPGGAEHPITLQWLAQELAMLQNPFAHSTSLSEFWASLVSNELWSLWWPLFFGCAVLGAVLGVASYFLVSFFWHIHVARAWERRRRQRQGKKAC